MGQREKSCRQSVPQRRADTKVIRRLTERGGGGREEQHRRTKINWGHQKFRNVRATMPCDSCHRVLSFWPVLWCHHCQLNSLWYRLHSFICTLQHFCSGLQSVCNSAPWFLALNFHCRVSALSLHPLWKNWDVTAVQPHNGAPQWIQRTRWTK